MIIVYGADWCEDTQRSLRHLRRLAIAHEYINIDEDSDCARTGEGAERRNAADADDRSRRRRQALVEPDNDTLSGALVEIQMLTQEDLHDRLGASERRRHRARAARRNWRGDHPASPAPRPAPQMAAAHRRYRGRGVRPDRLVSRVLQRRCVVTRRTGRSAPGSGAADMAGAGTRWAGASRPLPRGLVKQNARDRHHLRLRSVPFRRRQPHPHLRQARRSPDDCGGCRRRAFRRVGTRTPPPSASSGISTAGTRSAHRMRSLGPSGVWEAFVPGATEGQRYKFQLRTRTGASLAQGRPVRVRLRKPARVRFDRLRSAARLARRRVDDVNAPRTGLVASQADGRLRSASRFVGAHSRGRQPVSHIRGAAAVG